MALDAAQVEDETANCYYSIKKKYPNILFAGILKNNTGTAIEPGSPWENGYNESSNGKLRDGLLNGEEEQDDIIPCIIEEDGISPKQRKIWARLIQKIYEVYPLTCPKCQGSMKIISFIEKAAVVKKILKHLGLWEVKSRPPPRGHSPPGNFHTDYSDSQIPLWDDDQTSVSHPTYCVTPLVTKIQHYYHQDQ